MRVHRRLVSNDLHRDDLRGGQSPGEETPGRTTISPHGHIHVDDLPELVDCPVDIAPPTGHLDVSFVDPPAVADTMSTWACRLRQQRREALHPAKDADVIDGDATLGQQFFNISVGEPVAQVPANRERDHIRRSGSREDFHLPAPTDPYVNLSVHTALVTLVVRHAGPRRSISNVCTSGDTFR